MLRGKGDGELGYPGWVYHCLLKTTTILESELGSVQILLFQATCRSSIAHFELRQDDGLMKDCSTGPV